MFTKKCLQDLKKSAMLIKAKSTIKDLEEQEKGITKFENNLTNSFKSIGLDFIFNNQDTKFMFKKLKSREVLKICLYSLNFELEYKQNKLSNIYYLNGKKLNQKSLDKF